MIDIDYQITFQDDLDAAETSNEYNFNLPWVKWGIIRGVSAFLILVGILCVLEGTGIIDSSEDPYRDWATGIGLVSIAMGIAFPLIMQPKIAQFSLNRNNQKRMWNNKPKSEEFRNITLTKKEFIFTTEHSQFTWTWKAVKRFFESEKGFSI